MTLGIAAKSSIRKDKGVLSQVGPLSVMNTAAATESGTAITNARTDETIVPKTNGKAPKSPATGSQFELKKNFSPNCFRDSSECTISWYAISPTMASADAAHKKITARNPRSAKRAASGV